MNKYVFTMAKDEEVLEPLYSSNDKGAYISGWIRNTKTVIFKKIICGVKNINEFLIQRRRKYPNIAIIDWQEIK